jgi:hypothetical protein
MDQGLLGAKEERARSALIFGLLKAYKPHKALFFFCPFVSGLELWALIFPVSLLVTEGTLIFLYGLTSLGQYLWGVFFFSFFHFFMGPLLCLSFWLLS